MYSLYWAYVTTAHIGLGDITAINIPEKTFAILIMVISTITSTYIFGNLASMVNDLTPILKNRFDSNYSAVL